MQIVEYHSTTMFYKCKMSVTNYAKEFNKAQMIINFILNRTGLSFEQLTQKITSRVITEYKHITATLIMNLTSISESDCGKLLKISHPQVNWSVKKIENQLVDRAIAKRFYILRDRIKSVIGSTKTF